MPIYEYYCKICNHRFEEIKSFDESDLPALCPKCAFVANRIPSRFTCITDTNFFYTGKYDRRFDSVIEGRKDFWKKCEEKGYHEVPTKDFAVTTTLEDRMKNIPAPIE
jgi:putative FmdB family regulatory protein